MNPGFLGRGARETSIDRYRYYYTVIAVYKTKISKAKCVTFLNYMDPVLSKTTSLVRRDVSAKFLKRAPCLVLTVSDRSEVEIV